MAKPGRKPKPTAMRIREGNKGHRPLNQDEPVPPPGTPHCPTWLPADAKTVWYETLPMLQEMGVMSLIDGAALENYCQVMARWRRAEQFLAKHGSCYAATNKTGQKYLAQYPQVNEAAKLLALVKAYQQEFGMTPSARSGLHVEKAATTVDPLDEFLGPIGKVGA